jgi:hypothetical protein
MTFRQLVWELEGFFWGDALDPPLVASILAGGFKAVALLFPTPSRFDPDGQAFCGREMPFPVDTAKPDCAGMLLLRLGAAAYTPPSVDAAFLRG